MSTISVKTFLTVLPNINHIHSRPNIINIHIIETMKQTLKQNTETKDCLLVHGLLPMYVYTTQKTLLRVNDNGNPK
jgi:hypothetical protein